MKSRKLWAIFIAVLIVMALSTTAFALDESQVESAIAASSKEEVAGNVFIWFLCAVAFLKVSQKIDSFMTSLGINVGRTGGSMLAELMIAGRAIGSAVRATGGGSGGGTFNSVFNRSSSHSSTTNQAAGQNFSGGGSGVIGVAHRAVGNAAVANATGRGSGLGSVLGGAMFTSSMKNNGRFATDVISTVATGDIKSVGTIKGPQAAEALSNYLGYGAASAGTAGVQTKPGATVNPGTSGTAGAASVPSGSSQPAPKGFETTQPSTSDATGAPGVPSAPPATGQTRTESIKGGPGVSARNPVSTGAAQSQSAAKKGQTGNAQSVSQTGVNIPRSPAATSSAGASAQSRADRFEVGESRPIPNAPSGGEDHITLDGGAAAGAETFAGNAPSQDTGNAVPSQPPTFRDVEIGGGRITGYETPSGGGPERQFAMYNAEQYMEPTGSFERIDSVDGQTWYKQYAEPTVQKTPFEDDAGKIQYEEKIVEQLPQIPKRKDRV